MTERLERLGAVVRADFLIRLRRPSTLVVFLLLSAVPYAWIPDPSTGRTLLQIGNQRALYNSAAIGMATAALGTLFIGLAGFYVVSNALRRDVLSRCGYVIASTTMRGSEYIAGKFAGNVVFLSVFMFGFMLTSMAMVIVRGEAPLQPLVFAKQYLLLVPPSIVFVSAAALLFECTPLLRTKFGDVFYFFLWLGLMGTITALIEQDLAGSAARYFDVSGLGLILGQLKAQFHTSSMSIGASRFDASKGLAVFPGLLATSQWLVPRIGATLWPLALLAVARVFFHRFDPARVRAVPNEQSRRSWLGRFNLMAKPLARLTVSAGQRVLRGRVGADALTTIAAFPLATLAIVGFAIAALVSDAVLTGVLSIAHAACALAIADISSREKRAGTTALVYATPRLRTNFVWWKFASTLVVALAFLAVPLGRAIALHPSSAPALLIGILFTCAAATTLGIVSANPKTFIVAFLTFWYIATQDRGANPSMDFAGWYGTATPLVVFGYALSSLTLLTAAHLYHSNELRRRW